MQTLASAGFQLLSIANTAGVTKQFALQKEILNRIRVKDKTAYYLHLELYIFRLLCSTLEVC